jgi:hypothetical protein
VKTKKQILDKIRNIEKNISKLPSLDAMLADGKIEKIIIFAKLKSQLHVLTWVLEEADDK